MPPRRVLIAGPPQVGKTHLAHELCENEGYWFLNLNPESQEHAPPACCALLGPGARPRGFRFIGSLSLARDPIATCAAASWAVAACGTEPLVCELPIDRPSAVTVHLLRHLTAMLRPDLVVSLGYEAAAETLQPLPECEVQVRPPLEQVERRPEVAVLAWRKAAWRGLFEGAQVYSLPLTAVSLCGARHGAGVPLDSAELEALRALGFGSALYGEVVHGLLHVVTPGRVDSSVLSAAAGHFGCESVHLVEPGAYSGLVCGLENKLGEHFAVGRIIEMDFEGAGVRLQTPSQPPLPVWRLHVGHLRLDDEGNELGELKPWQV